MITKAAYKFKKLIDPANIGIPLNKLKKPKVGPKPINPANIGMPIKRKTSLDPANIGIPLNKVRQ